MGPGCVCAENAEVIFYVMNGTSSAKIHCPRCEKPILSQVALAEGTRFVVRCPNPQCNAMIKIIATFNVIHKRLLTDLHEQRMIETEAGNSPA